MNKKVTLVRSNSSALNKPMGRSTKPPKFKPTPLVTHQSDQKSDKVQSILDLIDRQLIIKRNNREKEYAMPDLFTINDSQNEIINPQINKQPSMNFDQSSIVWQEEVSPMGELQGMISSPRNEIKQQPKMECPMLNVNTNSSKQIKQAANQEFRLSCDNVEILVQVIPKQPTNVDVTSQFGIVRHGVDVEQQTSSTEIHTPTRKNDYIGRHQTTDTFNSEELQFRNRTNRNSDSKLYQNSTSQTKQKKRNLGYFQYQVSIYQPIRSEADSESGKDILGSCYFQRPKNNTNINRRNQEKYRLSYNSELLQSKELLDPHRQASQQTCMHTIEDLEIDMDGLDLQSGKGSIKGTTNTPQVETVATLLAHTKPISTKAAVKCIKPYAYFRTAHKQSLNRNK